MPMFVIIQVSCFAKILYTSSSLLCLITWWLWFRASQSSYCIVHWMQQLLNVPFDCGHVNNNFLFSAFLLCCMQGYCGDCESCLAGIFCDMYLLLILIFCIISLGCIVWIRPSARGELYKKVLTAWWSRQLRRLVGRTNLAHAVTIAGVDCSVVEESKLHILWEGRTFEGYCVP